MKVSMAIAVALLHRSPATGGLALAWAVLVGLSRILLGVHYPSDVLGGVLLAALTACGVVLPWRKRLSALRDSMRCG